MMRYLNSYNQMERLVSQIQVFLEMKSSHHFEMVCIRVLIGGLNGRLKLRTSSYSMYRPALLITVLSLMGNQTKALG